MDQNEFEILLRMIDRMIDTAVPIRAEYLRGYREGIRLHHIGGWTKNRPRRYKSHKDNGDPYLDAFFRGFMDGCNGAELGELAEFIAAFKAS